MNEIFSYSKHRDVSTTINTIQKTTSSFSAKVPEGRMWISSSMFHPYLHQSVNTTKRSPTRPIVCWTKKVAGSNMPNLNRELFGKKYRKVDVSCQTYSRTYEYLSKGVEWRCPKSWTVIIDCETRNGPCSSIHNRLSTLLGYCSGLL